MATYSNFLSGSSGQLLIAGEADTVALTLATLQVKGGAFSTANADNSARGAITGGAGSFDSLSVSGALDVGGNFSVATDKFTVAAASGNTTVAGTLGVAGNFAINTDKFVVTASSGDTNILGSMTIAGDLTVNGTTTTINTQDLLVTDNTMVLNSAPTTIRDAAMVFAQKIPVGGPDYYALTWSTANSEFRLGQIPSSDVGTPTTISITAYSDLHIADLTAVNATLSGDLSAVDASLSGDLSAVNAALSGDLDLTGDLNISGNIDKAVGTLAITAGTRVSVSDVTFASGAVGNITTLSSSGAATLASSGAASSFGGDLSVSGALSAASASITNGVSADHGNFVGEVTADHISTDDYATFGGLVTAESLAVSNASTLSGSLTVTGTPRFDSAMKLKTVASSPASVNDYGFMFVKTDGTTTKEELFYLSDAGEVQITKNGALNVDEISMALQSAYDGGQSITMSAAKGDMAFYGASSGSWIFGYDNASLTQAGSGIVQFSGGVSAAAGLLVSGNDLAVSTDKFVVNHSTGAVSSSGVMDITVAGLSTWKSTSGGLVVKTDAGPLSIDGKSVVSLKKDGTEYLKIGANASRVDVQANIDFVALSGTSKLDFSGASGDFKASTGALSWAGANTKAASIVSTGAAITVTAGAASTWSTSSGALTLTSAAAATWSTSAGALTLTSAAAATWSTAAGKLTLQGASDAQLTAAAGNLKLSASGYITTVGMQAGAAVTSGALLAVTSAGKVIHATNASDSFIAGIASAAISNNAFGEIASMPGTKMVVKTNISAYTNGAVVYLGTDGDVTSTAPSAAGSYVIRVGVVADAANGKIIYAPQYMYKNP